MGVVFTVLSLFILFCMAVVGEAGSLIRAIVMWPIIIVAVIIWALIRL